jgi:hypothetical protein
MLMRDKPLTIKLAVANSRAPLHLEFLSIFLHCPDPVEAIAEGHVITCRDAPAFDTKVKSRTTL